MTEICLSKKVKSHVEIPETLVKALGECRIFGKQWFSAFQTLSLELDKPINCIVGEFIAGS